MAGAAALAGLVASPRVGVQVVAALAALAAMAPLVAMVDSL